MKNLTKTAPVSRKEKNQGMNWIRQSTRLSIYLRDGLACAWCGASVEDGTKLTLDHLKPYSRGGSNASTNLVTACLRCNSSRGNRSVTEFASAVAGYLNHGAVPAEIVSHVRACARRQPDRTGALEMLARRGSVAQVLSE